MKTCVIGNCQIAALRPLLQALHGDLECPPFPAVHTMGPQHENTLSAVMDKSDWIVAQLVASDYPIEFVRTNVLRDRFGERLIVWPNLYFNGYAPEFNTLRNVAYRNFTGPLLDYHSDKILFGFMEGFSVAETLDLVRKASVIDELWYGNAVSAGLAELKRREQSTDITISDFVEEKFARQRLFYIMNHPAIAPLNELASRILTKMGVSRKLDPPASLFADFELLSAWYPENPFIRDKYGFSFPGSRIYRGVRLVAADTPLGVTPDGPRLFEESEMIEAMYRFYEPHAEILREHGRVKELLRRPRS